jgi:hypothetical protein
MLFQLEDSCSYYSLKGGVTIDCLKYLNELVDVLKGKVSCFCDAELYLSQGAKGQAGDKVYDTVEASRVAISINIELDVHLEDKV